MPSRRIVIFTCHERSIFQGKEGDVFSITDRDSNTFVRTEGKMLHFGWKKVTFFAYEYLLLNIWENNK